MGLLVKARQLLRNGACREAANSGGTLALQALPARSAVALARRAAPAPLSPLLHPPSPPAAVTALSLCELLRELAASRGCTILTTIHQPSSKIFELFHNLILLQAGAAWLGVRACMRAAAWDRCATCGCGNGSMRFN